MYKRFREEPKREKTTQIYPRCTYVMNVAKHSIVATGSRNIFQRFMVERGCYAVSVANLFLIPGGSRGISHSTQGRKILFVQSVTNHFLEKINCKSISSVCIQKSRNNT